MLVGADARTIALRGPDGLLHFAARPPDRFAAGEWLRRDGDAREVNAAIGMPGLLCDGLGCAVPDKVMIALALRPEALAEDCLRAAIVISAVPGRCDGPAIMIDQDSAARDGGYRIALSQTPTALSVREWRGERPWVSQ
jgi:competence protein ComEC